MGLELIKKNKYDMVFLDEDMPELTGLEISEYVRHNNINTKTIILSGYEEIEEKFCKRVGADEYLCKPVDYKKRRWLKISC
jgi:YesN/AraC family two-component response regulator